MFKACIVPTARVSFQSGKPVSVTSRRIGSNRHPGLGSLAADSTVQRSGYPVRNYHTHSSTGQQELLPLPGETLPEVIKRLSLKFILFSWTDLFGTSRAKLVPAAEAHAVVSGGGAGFAGFAAHLLISPSQPDVLALPDLRSLMVLPWQREVAWVACDLTMSGQPIAHSPRYVLRRSLDRLAQEHKLTFKTGIELEFHLLNPQTPAGKGLTMADTLDTEIKPCYSVAPLMRNFDFLSSLLEYMEQLGWQPYQVDHEDSNGQYELNWKYADALETADRQAFYKYMVRTLAEKHGLRATFMPKPFVNKSGNGCHVHLSLHQQDEKETNVFSGSEPLSPAHPELKLSKTARYFCGGLIEHAAAITAFANPTINSYKRLNAPTTSSGCTWAPTTATWTDNNRTHMVRVPDAQRFEIRLPDASTNPYLLPAVLLEAGVLGMSQSLDPGPPSLYNSYENVNVKSKAKDMMGQLKRTSKRSKQIPKNMLDALRSLRADKAIRTRVGEELCKAYTTLRLQQWHAYTASLSAWELENTLDD
eukprot:gb/GEZN01004394.1/.p1 GENE.gb/GEZN01004394.1/~~gb/GEZN01004394.1/.p1  ORF type:complete len:532 (-),score=48.79 gb/GEZN01004394.1/:351-1946(-)